MPLKRNGSSPHASFRKRKTSSKASRLIAVGFALVAGGRGHVNLLRHLVEPAGLVTAREAHEGPALGQLIQPCDFEREAQRIPSRQHVADRADLDPLGVVDHVLRQHRQAAHLEAFAVQMMLGEADRVEAHFLRQLRDLHHFVDHALPAVGTVRDRAQRTPLFDRGRKAGKEKVHEFHRGLPPTGAAIVGRIIRPLHSEMLPEKGAESPAEAVPRGFRRRLFERRPLCVLWARPERPRKRLADRASTGGQGAPRTLPQERRRWISKSPPKSPRTLPNWTSSSSAKSSRSNAKTTTSASSTIAANGRAPTSNAAACRATNGRTLLAEMRRRADRAGHYRFALPKEVRRQGRLQPRDGDHPRASRGQGVGPAQRSSERKLDRR